MNIPSTKHSKFDYLLKIVKSNIPLHLIGPSGSGKSTIALQIAEALNVPIGVLPCTEATSVGNLLGFKTVTNEYASTTFRDAVELGHVYVLEELTAVNKNVILCINSLDNGFIAFPDKIVSVHPNFRLIATSNPVTNEYGARSPLDFSTLNRYYNVNLEADEAITQSFASPEAMEQIAILKAFIEKDGISLTLTPRDTKLLQQLIDLGLDTDPIYRLIDTQPIHVKDAFKLYYADYKQKIEERIRAKQAHEKFLAKPQSELNSLDEIIKQVNEKSIDTDTIPF